MKALPTDLLLVSSGAPERAELFWRLSVPISAFILVLLAIPLSYVNPRMGRSFNLITAAFMYTVYNNCLNIVQSVIAQGRLSMLVGSGPRSQHRCDRGHPAVLEPAVDYRPVPSPAGARMKTLSRYIGREVLFATMLIFVALLLLFAFFDLIHELGNVGKEGYPLGRALLFVGLSVPGPSTSWCLPPR